MRRVSPDFWDTFLLTMTPNNCRIGGRDRSSDGRRITFPKDTIQGPRKPIATTYNSLDSLRLAGGFA